MRIYPFTYALYDDVEQVMNSLTSYDREKWAAAFSSVAKPYEVKASQAEKTGDAQSAKENYLRAYQYYRLARYPTINSDGKKEAYRKSQEMLFKASRYFDFPIERVEMPFKAKSGEGNSIIGYLRLPKLGTVPFPLLMSWGGIHGFKEGQLNDPALERGLATLAIDGPGVGNSPIKGSEDAEKLFGAVFDWVGTQRTLDSNRVGIWGYSTGGYGRLRWLTFIARAFAFGMSTYDEWVEYAPKLSLLKQGILDRPSAPLLLVNGIHDSVFPIRDYYLLLEHCSPKCARFYDAGHMGFTKDTFETILNWICEKLS